MGISRGRARVAETGNAFLCVLDTQLVRISQPPWRGKRGFWQPEQRRRKQVVRRAREEGEGSGRRGADPPFGVRKTFCRGSVVVAQRSGWT